MVLSRLLLTTAVFREFRKDPVRSEVLTTSERSASTFFTFMHLADAFIQSDLQCIQAIHFYHMCVLWELNP